jgi:hypothetical protein
MSIERQCCYLVVCDSCRASHGEPDSEIVLHFDTPDTAIADAIDAGWQIDTDGHLLCHRCVASAHCTQVGHDYTPWMPCACEGAYPDHALWGCGLLRYCQRTGCEHAESATLAALPTTDEPPRLGG